MTLALKHALLIGPPSPDRTAYARSVYQRHRSAIEHRVSDYAYRCAALETCQPGFRAPHHTCSAAAMFGSLRGHEWRPGEVSLASGGILFLDDLPEFPKAILDGVLEAMKSREVTLVNARNTLHVPANFTLFATASPCPCPCGFRGLVPWNGDEPPCKCSDAAVERYQERYRSFRDVCNVLGPSNYRMVTVDIALYETTGDPLPSAGRPIELGFVDAGVRRVFKS